MITQLKIRNYALIESLEMCPTSGLNTITGETGAGKSIMLGAIGLLLGNRADTKTLNNKESKCTIEAEFDIAAYELEELFEEVDLDYETISIFRREVNPKGKSRAFINDTPVTLEVLKRVGKYLLNVHSQHETLDLGKKDFQLQIVDEYANNEKLLSQYSDVYKKFIVAKSEYVTLQQERTDSNKENDYEKFLLEELVQANFQNDEQEALEEELKVLEHGEEIKSLLFESSALLSDSEYAAMNNLQSVKQQLQKLASISLNFEQLYQRFETSIIELEDISNTIEFEIQSVELNPQRLVEVQERISLLYSLLQKHNVKSVEELNDIKEKLEQKVCRYTDLDEIIAEKKLLLDELTTKATNYALELNTRRSESFPALKTELENLLVNVGIENGQVDFLIREKELDEFGKDRIQLMFSANKGIKPQSLKQIASGGELSRLMFCVKYILAKKMALPTIIFDEIDTGISGEIALKMGRMMDEMATNHQVLTITHLPQIAAFGKTHFYVYKDQKNEKAKSNIRMLEDSEREFELAKMIGGEQPSGAAIESARELLINN